MDKGWLVRYVYMYVCMYVGVFTRGGGGWVGLITCVQYEYTSSLSKVSTSGSVSSSSMGSPDDDDYERWLTKITVNVFF